MATKKKARKPKKSQQEIDAEDTALLEEVVPDEANAEQPDKNTQVPPAAEVDAPEDYGTEEEKEKSVQEDTSNSLNEEKGVLMLRMFSKDERTGKILTRLKRKVFFPADPNLEPGWYVATIVEAKENYGVMDTIELDKVPDHLWHHKHIKGIFIERNHKKNCLEIYPAIPRAQLEEQRPVLIFTVPLPEPRFKRGATIGEIIAAKKNL